MQRVLSPIIVILMLAFGLYAQTAPDAGELTKLLKDFLDGASRNDAAIHDHFWADDLIYTGSNGRRRGKVDVMRDVRSAPARKPGDPTTNYTPEDIRIQQYGNTAIVAFRLVGTTRNGEKTEVANFLNSGTFLRRNGKWQVVNWQATRMPRTEEEVRKEVAAPEPRTVKGLVLTSKEMPAVRLKFSEPFSYVGMQSFVLYDVANAEQHFFVDADKQGRIRRLYWVQFEGYLPNNTHTYSYKVSKTVNLGGFEFIADAYARNIKATPGRPDSDGSLARSFLESKGYRIASEDVLSQRLVHLVDEAKRNELMIIYLEDLGTLGFTAADLSPGGRAADKWDQISKGLLERALKGLEVLR